MPLSDPRVPTSDPWVPTSDLRVPTSDPCGDTMGAHSDPRITNSVKSVHIQGCKHGFAGFAPSIGVTKGSEMAQNRVFGTTHFDSLFGREEGFARKPGIYVIFREFSQNSAKWPDLWPFFWQF